MSQRKSIFIVLLLVLGFLGGCGSDDDNNDNAQQEETQNQNDQGTYEAVLNPVNVSVGGSTEGTATINISGDLLKAHVQVKSAPFGTHRQFIHLSGTCPSSLNDVNRDGIVDEAEGMTAAGNFLVPLDNHLETQLQDLFPRGSFYSYNQSGSYSRLLSDLHSPDPTPEDNVAKLDPSSNLNLEGRTVIIYGANSLVTVPIACGVLVRVAQREEPVPVPVPVPVPTPVPVPVCPPKKDFSTRLSNNLLIAGVPCKGGETTQVITADGRSEIFVCQKNQWLITVDNENVCTSEGGCTDVFIFPIISTIVKASTSNAPTQCTFNMRPKSPAGREEIHLMRQHQVRFFQDQAPQVIRRE